MPKYSMAFDLAPHKAHYDVNLVKAVPTLPLTSIFGTVELSITHRCNHWHTEYKNNAEFHYRDRQPSKIELSHVSHEDILKQTINYARQEQNNNQLEMFERGHATVQDNMLSWSKVIGNKTIDRQVEGAYMFPIAHTIAVLEQIKNNIQSQSYYVFDGVEDTNEHAFHKVIVTIGNKKSDAFGGQWPVHFAYYDVGQDDMVPTHEMDMVMRKNGIIDHMAFIYDDFMVEQTLKDVKELEHHECD